eukprot:scaffold613_cov243-Pinguiococcus_pyrenoidosus.AAC.2
MEFLRRGPTPPQVSSPAPPAMAAGHRRLWTAFADASQKSSVAEVRPSFRRRTREDRSKAWSPKAGKAVCVAWSFPPPPPARACEISAAMTTWASPGLGSSPSGLSGCIAASRRIDSPWPLR